MARTRRLVTWLALAAGLGAAAGAALLADGSATDAIVVVLGTAAVVSIWGAVEINNRLVRVKLLQDRALSLIDVELARRSDLVPQLVAVVRAAAEHEASTLEAVASSRPATGQVSIIAEHLPELGTSASFRALADELAATESRITAARAYCNDTITIVRDRTRTFPGLLLVGIARSGRFGARELLDLETMGP